MKCDLHVHSCYSYDSTSLAKQVVKEALKKGIDCLAITDHEEIRGAKEVVKEAQGKPLLIIPGIEVKSRQGDILGLNVREVIRAGLSAEKIIKRIKELGGLAIIAHPFSPFYSFRGNLEDLIGQMDGIEAFNAAIFSSANKKALQFAQKHNIPFAAGSDAHFPNFIGRGYLEIAGQDLSIEEVLRAVKEKRGQIKGKENSALEKVIDHARRAIKI